MQMEDEKTVIAVVLAGDAEAFGTLVRTHQAKIRLVCLARLGLRDEADDAAQDVFVKAYKALPAFKGDSSFGTWMVRIADNHCLDILRTRTKHRTQSLEALLEAKGDAFDGLLSRMNAAENPPPYSPVDLELLGRLFAALSQDDREILTLREVEELPYEDIAKQLNCSLDAVKGRLKRARQTLISKCAHFVDTLSK